MRNPRLARRYAEALGELARDREELDQVEGDLKSVQEVMDTQEGFVRLLADKNVSVGEKDRLVQSLFGDGRVSRISLNFLRLVISRRREVYLSEMIEHFFAYADRARGIVEIDVTTAAPLTESDEAALIETLAAVTGRQVKLLKKEDAAILGGVVARLGDLVMDGSVRTRLEALRENLMRAQLN